MIKRTIDHLLGRIAGVFIRCFFLSFALLIVWFFFYVLLGDMGYKMHARLFELSRHDYALVNYCGMAFAKISATLFFLVPYFAIRVVLRKTR